jgi:thioredoxin reductase
VAGDQAARPPRLPRNRPNRRYRLDCQVSFRYRGSELAAQASSGAVRYDISYQPERGLTGADARGNGGSLRTLETSVPGIFAVGDVRSGSTERVAAAVGGMGVRFS